jgi:hypothetical protein
MLDAHHERMTASVNTWQKETMACQEAMEAYPEGMKSEMEQKNAPKEKVPAKSVRALKGPASSSRTPRSAEGTDPGLGWVPEEFVHRPLRSDPPCRSGTARGTRSSGTRQGQCGMRSSKRADAR